jgi:hypothetical protein
LRRCGNIANGYEETLQAKAGGWVDVNRSIQLFDEDIEAVEAGLARL